MTDELRSKAVSNLAVDDLADLVKDESTVELLTVVARRFEEHRQAQSGSPAGREFALAATHLEDAITRWNKGIYRMRGTFAISDAEMQTPVEEVEA